MPADQYPEVLGEGDQFETGDAGDGEDMQQLRMPTPSGEASTSGFDHSEDDKYPPLPERGYCVYELFAKAALEEVADYLRESESLHACWQCSIQICQGSATWT